MDPKLRPGTNHCLCRACGSYFGGVWGFEQHRVGPSNDRSCLSPSAMRDGGLVLNSKGYWIRSFRRVATNLGLM